MIRVVIYAAMIGAVIVTTGWALSGPLITRSREKRENRSRSIHSKHKARRDLRMPVGHPESLTAELSDEDEEYLGYLCEDLWPLDEWAEITREEDEKRWGKQ